MKRISGKMIPLLCLSLLATLIAAQSKDAPITKEEIVARAWKAMFGDRQDKEVKSLYVEGFFHGRPVPNRITIERPNLFRNETAEGTLVFDGKRAAWVTREPDKDGKPRNPELIAPEHWRHFEVDIAIVFPAIFDHPAELQGTEKVNGVDAYKLFVPLPLGSHVTYFVDCKSFLVTRRLISWDGGKELWENLVEGYLDLGGIRFPDGYSFAGREGREKGIYQNVRFNVSPAGDLFKIPEDLK